MSPVTAFFVYLLIWWLMIFTVLPLGIKTDEAGGEGHQPGAPANPNLNKKFILNTAISLVILAIIEVLIRTGVIQWAAWFEPIWNQQ